MQLSSLLRFCSTDTEPRYAGVVAPRKMDGHYYATDTKIGVRVPEPSVADKFPPIAGMANVWSKFPLPAPQRPDLHDLPKQTFTITESEDGQLIEPCEERPFQPAGLAMFYELSQLRKIATLLDLRWQEIDGKLLFEFAEDGQGILMPITVD